MGNEPSSFLQKWKSDDPRPIKERLGYDPFENEFVPATDEVNGEEYLVIGTPLGEPDADYLYCVKTGKFLLRESSSDNNGLVTSRYEEFEPTKQRLFGA